jgi:hypothetical protein
MVQIPTNGVKSQVQAGTQIKEESCHGTKLGSAAVLITQASGLLFTMQILRTAQVVP